jgi:hypothetical protein
MSTPDGDRQLFSAPVARPGTASQRSECDRAVDRWMQGKLNLLAGCSCCERHNEYKPGLWKPWKDGARKNGEINQCKCPCRHMARRICRLHPEGPNACPHDLDVFLKSEDKELEPWEREQSVGMVGIWG